ncbi:MAG: CRISPR-associated ring nuclease Csm6 [Gammaproteobacteria bacterium]
MQPHEYPRRILLAVTGRSPQLVTESLYALAVGYAPPFVPTEVRIITTSEGAEHARLELLSNEPGWFSRLRNDYDLPEMQFDDACIHVLCDPQGRALPDIRSAVDNACAADFITEQVRTLTADPEAALHVSIAGGRKTMGFYLGYALSLFGRPQDRLSHVLVSPSFESHPLFYYPSPDERVIRTQDRSQLPLDARRAEVTLAEIPFVRLRERILPDRLLEGTASYSETVAAAQRALGPADLIIDLPGRRVRAGGAWVEMAPAPLAFLIWMARRCVQDLPPIACPADGAPDTGFAVEYLTEYRAILGRMGDDDRASKRLAEGMDKGTFLERKSEVNSLLGTTLGPAARDYKIHSFGRRPRTRFGLKLPAEAISFTPGRNPL